MRGEREVVTVQIREVRVMRGSCLATTIVLLAVVACGTTTNNTTNITIVSDAGSPPETASDAADGSSNTIDASVDAGSDGNGADASTDDAGDAGPRVCTGGNDPSTIVSNNCTGGMVCPALWNYCGGAGYAFTCDNDTGRPALDDCRQTPAGWHCCMPACVRLTSNDADCGSSHAYSCPYDKDGNPVVAPPAGCTKAQPQPVGKGYVVCCPN